MNPALWLILCYNFISLSLPVFLLSPENVEIIEQGQTAMLNGDYKTAYKMLDELCLEDTTDPSGYIFRAAVLQAEMIDKEENLYGDKLKALCDSTRLMAQERLIKCSSQDSALCYLYLGHQYAYRALWEARFGSKLSALKSGFKARSQYQKGLDIDSTLYDLYLGLGSFHYWKSVKSGLLRWVGIFKDERKKGISEVKLAADSSLFSREASHSALIWILINEKEYDSAIALSKTMLLKYPDGNSLLWPLAESYFKSEQYEAAAETYGLILKHLKNNPGNYYNIIESIYWFYKSLQIIEQSEELKDAIVYFNSIYNDIPKSTLKRQKSKLRFLENHD